MIEKKKDFEDELLKAIVTNKAFDGLIVSVKALDQLSDPSHPNDIRLEVHVLINGYVQGLPCRDIDIERP